MRDYQPLKNNPYYIEPSIYKAILYIIRSYGALKKEYEELIEIKTYPKFEPNKSGNNYNKNDITGEIAIKLERKAHIINAIESALKKFNELENEKYYIKGIWENIINSTPYPCDAASSTYSRHKARFIWLIGKNLDMI